MNISRRSFVKGGFAAATMPAFAGGAEAPKLRFGLISDIHISRSWESAKRVFRPALEWFRDQGVDAVVCNGDLATTGMLVELEHMSRAWYEVFPDDMFPDGRKVEKVFVYGNHDTDPRVKKYSIMRGAEEEFNRASVQRDRAYSWKKCLHEPFAPVYMKRIKGYAFIGAHWVNSPSIKDAPGFIKAHRAELEGDLPFFYCQHAPLKGTVNEHSGKGHYDNGEVSKVLVGFPNAIALTGHSHCALTDETSIWQGEFTAVNSAAFANSGRRYTNPWFEDSDVPGTPSNAYRDRKGSQMPAINTTRNGAQGMLVDVFADRIVFHRRSFIYNEPNGEDWVVPLPLGKEKPYLVETRKAASMPPQFAAGAKVSAKERDGANRENEPVRQLVVSFPAATIGTRPFGYEVTVASDAPGSKPTSRCVFSPDFNLPLSQRVDRAECVFAVSDLPAEGKRSISVRAFDSFFNYGEPIS